MNRPARSTGRTIGARAETRRRDADAHLLLVRPRGAILRQKLQDLVHALFLRRPHRGRRRRSGHADDVSRLCRPPAAGAIGRRRGARGFARPTRRRGRRRARRCARRGRVPWTRWEGRDVRGRACARLAVRDLASRARRRPRRRAQLAPVAVGVAATLTGDEHTDRATAKSSKRAHTPRTPPRRVASDVRDGSDPPSGEARAPRRRAAVAAVAVAVAAGAVAVRALRRGRARRREVRTAQELSLIHI